MGQPLPAKHFTASERFTAPEHSVVPKYFGHYLNVLLEAHQFSVLKLAEAAGLEPDFTFQLLGGRQILTADVAFALAEVFGESPLTLLEAQRSSLLGAREQREEKLAA